MGATPLMRKSTPTIQVAVSERVYIDTEVDIEVADFVNGLGIRDKKVLAEALLGEQLADDVPDGFGRTAGDYIERAYLAAKAMPDCPPAIRDLLWRVHGRAI